MRKSAPDDAVSIIADEARDVADELEGEKRHPSREVARQEAELEAARAEVTALKARRNALTGPYAERRLTALRQALRASPLTWLP